jgi:hypothetical protein
MFARSTTINGDPGSVEQGIAFVHDEVMPMMTKVPGFVGLSMMVDRRYGRGIATSSWATYDDMVASTEAVGGARATAAEMMTGDTYVDEWEIAVMHREHQAGVDSCCRVTWFEMEPASVEKLIHHFGATVMPSLEEVTGFCSASLLVDRERGRGCSTECYDDRAAMLDSAPAARRLREAGVRELGMRMVDIQEFDLELAHLRVPELV